MNNYLTEENVRKLREELDYRMSVVRAKIAKRNLRQRPMVIDQKTLSIRKLVETIEKMIIEYNTF